MTQVHTIVSDIYPCKEADKCGWHEPESKVSLPYHVQPYFLTEVVLHWIYTMAPRNMTGRQPI